MHPQSYFPSYLRVSQAITKGRFPMLLMEQHCRDGSTYSEGNSKVGPFKMPNWDPNYLLSTRNRHDWSFAFAHASTSSKCILFAIRCLPQLDPYIEPPWGMDWIVSETIDWLKVHDPALITEIFCNPDNLKFRTKQSILNRKIT
jgi:hypothetical protein